MRYRALLILWLLTDPLLFIGSYALAYVLRVGWILSSDFPFDRLLTTATLIAPFFLLVLATTRTFHLGSNQQSLQNLAYIAYSAIVGTALFTLAYYFRYTAFFSRLLLIEAFGLSTLLIWGWHILFDAVKRRLLRRDPPTFPLLVVGLTREARALITLLNRRKNALTPVAILEVQGAKERDVDGVPVLGKLNILEDVLQEKRITHLLQTSNLEQSINLLSACRKHSIAYLLLPSVLGIVEREGRMDVLEGSPVTVVSPQRGTWEKFFLR